MISGLNESGKRIYGRGKKSEFPDLWDIIDLGTDDKDDHQCEADIAYT